MTKPRKNAPRKAGRARRAAADGMPAATDAVVATAEAAATHVGTTAAQAPVTALDLGSSCTLLDVAALRVACIAALDCKDPPVIDGSFVERVDAAGVQVLVGFTIDCMERSINFSWVGRSPQLAHAIHLLGVDALLESPGAATPMGGMA
jgi:ABC-type transporter Mla MlaB component